MMKEFEGGVLVMTGANSAVGLRSMPARYLFMDEIDAYPGDLDGEGDPISLAMKRTSTFKRNRKVFMPSTPTVKEASHVERFFLQSDQRYYYLPCPHCGHYQTITWAKIVWKEGEPDTAEMCCESCGALIPEQHKTQMLEQGEWRATAKSSDPTLRGYHLSALYSPLGWYSWSDAARDFLAAKNNRESMKTWINTTLGETWEEDGQQADPNALIAFAENYDSGYIPDSVLLLTAGIDTQDDRLECQIIGWSTGGTPWIIDHSIFWGDPAKPDCWRDLDNHLLQSYGGLKIVSAFIDSGGHHTEAVYKWAKQRHGRKIFAC
jgi:phage terminase large subunit GpA-like protein